MRNNGDEPWYNNNMQESDLPDLHEEKVYVLSSTCPGTIQKAKYLLNSGKIVSGISTSLKDAVVYWVNHDKDIYLGVGVLHA
jgi:hypothetical protein